MGRSSILRFVLLALACFAAAEDEYQYFTWTVTYGTISPLGVSQQGILINGEFPGPQLFCTTNDNLIISVINQLDEPFLLTWQGIKQRKNSWQDGVLGTNCPIPPGKNYTYKMQAKDQIGSYTYFPSTAMHRAAGGFGGLNVLSRSVIPVPYPPPDADFTLLIGDWFKSDHKQVLKQRLDSGIPLPFPDGLLINGIQNSTELFATKGRTYRFRISNVGLSTSINFRIQNHKLKVVEVEGSHVLQNFYDSLDIHVGQSVTVLLTLDQAPRGYYFAASTRFTRTVLTASGILYYNNFKFEVSGSIPPPPSGQHHWSMLQARTFRWNLTANAARPNPQGSYHYGKIPITKTLVLGNSATEIGGKLRYAVNNVSFVVPETPLKLADYFNISSGVFTWDSIPTSPADGTARFDTPVVRAALHDFVEIVFQNDEKTIQSWHLDGYDFWVVGYGSGMWTPATRQRYNLIDALTRYTIQVYPKGWSAILVSLDNQGMWNLRSAMWARQYLGQQFYIRVWTSEVSLSNEYAIPSNVLLCGKAKGLKP